MDKILYVGAGGFLGAILRYSVFVTVDRFWPTAAFPWGTLLVNVAGCVAIGAMAGLAETRQVLSPEARLLLVVGVLGSFTTFSTLGFETFGCATARSAAVT